MDLCTFCCPLLITWLSVCVIGVSKGNRREESCPDSMAVVSGGHKFLQPRTYFCSGLHVGVKSFRLRRDTTREWETMYSLLDAFDFLIKIARHNRKGMLSAESKAVFNFYLFSLFILNRGTSIPDSTRQTLHWGWCCLRIPWSAHGNETDCAHRQFPPKMPLVNALTWDGKTLGTLKCPGCNFSKIFRTLFSADSRDDDND